jgi:hypothetical protein
MKSLDRKLYGIMNLQNKEADEAEISLCGLVVRVPGYRSGGLCSIPGATRFSDKRWVWNGVHSAS